MVIERFIQYVENKGLALSKAEAQLGLSNGYLGKMRDRKASIGSNIIEKIVSVYPDIDIHWLITGRKLSVINKGKSISTSSTGIPYYEKLPVSAGDFPSFLTQLKPTSYIDLPQLTNCTAVLPVYGSSMKGVVEPGDLIAIKEIVGRDEFDPSLPYLVITEEHRMIKYLRMDELDSSIIWAESTNHAKIKLSTDNIKMVYAIKCVIRFY